MRLFLFFARLQLVHVACSDDTGGKGNDSNAHHGREDADDAPHVRDRIEVAVADGRQCDKRIPERVGEREDRSAGLAALAQGERDEKDNV